MTELDFEELDKAVNSVMGKSSAPSNDQTSASPADVGSSENQPDAPAAVPVATSPQAVAPATTSASLAARRGSGRFMDVMRTPGDVAKKVSPTPPTSPAPNFVVETLEPSIVTPEKETEPSDVASDLPKLDSWPDSIDFSDEAAAPPAAEAEPLTSPFIPNAVVEKRPLGGVSGEQPSESEVPVAEQDSAVAPGTEVPVVAEQPAKDSTVSGNKQASWGASMPDTDAKAEAATEIKPALPAELDSNLVAIESGGVQTVSEASGDAVLPSGKKLGSGSITQQYQEQPSTTDQGHTPIYETGEAHQPLAHPAKKKPGWLWVVLILAFAVIGCGIGAAVYFSGALNSV